MKASTAVVLFVAILAGVIASITARGIILSQKRSPNAKIVVAAKPIPFGAVVVRESLQEQLWGSDQAPDGAFNSIDAFLKDGDRIALNQISKNEPVLKSRVSAPGQKSVLSGLIQPGMRAVTVRVDDVRGVAGFIMPGDRVDIALTREAEKKKFTDILLQNVKVLAIDQLAGDWQEKAQVAKAVTLEVSSEQGQKLILAGGAGTLSLILRETSGAAETATRRITLEDLGQTEVVNSDKPDQEPVAKPEPPSTAKVQVIRGAQSRELEVYRE